MYILQKRNSKTFSKNFALKHCDHSFQFFHSSQRFALFPLPNINLPSISSLVKSTFQNTTTSHDKKRYNKTRQKPKYEGWTKQPNKRKSFNNRQKSQKFICSLYQKFLKTTKLTAIPHVKRIWCTPMQAQCLLVLFLWVYMRLLSWFSGQCSPGFLHPLWLLLSFFAVFLGIFWALRWENQ